ncbi:hypothetical protein ABY42_18645 (plasmid) [Haloferax gibbonsii]|uniref:GH141-like insertion domain-containing protein n=2 Tax=Haloferax gibbonsii TaxID=35746 RepID=A0A0K1IZ89_HALGI|nr:hypothetical protein ABY42_18645 [Haloferax gibbonsii]
MTGRVAAAQQVYYVSPSGDDTNGDGSKSNPWQTITKARDEVRSVNGNMSGNIEVRLRGGTYQLSSTVNFTSQDSGTNGYDVIWKAYQDEDVTISGGTEVTGWSDQGDGTYAASVASVEIRSLYVNDERATRARTTENTGVDRKNTGEVDSHVTWNSSDNPVVPADSFNESWDLGTIRLVIEPHWYQFNIRVSDYNISGSEVEIIPEEPEASEISNRTYVFDDGQPFYFENAKSMLTDDGEWFHDQSADTLYYKPRDGESPPTNSSTTVHRSGLETLVSLSGTDNVRFEGLEFAHTDWTYPLNNGLIATQSSRPQNDIDAMRAAVETDDTTNVTFERNVFKLVGGSGLLVKQPATNTTVTGNAFRDMAANGVMFTHPYMSEPSSGVLDSTIDNNYFTRFGQTYNNGDAIIANWVQNVLIEHNTVWNGPYTGIGLGYGYKDVDTLLGDNTVQRNEIHDVMLQHDDGGGIYTLSYQENSSIHENYLHDITRVSQPRGESYPVAAIYLDEQSEGFTVDSNYVENVTKEINLHDAENNTFTNNDTTDTTIRDNAGVTSSYADMESATSIEKGPRVVRSSDSGGSIELLFNESLDSSTATDTSNYSLSSGSVDSASLSTTKHTVTLSTSGTSGSITLSIDGVTNLAGNSLTTSIEFGSPFEYQRLYWPLNSGSGSAALDASNRGSVNDGSISGASWTTSGKYGDALSFSAPSDEVSTDSLDLTTSEFTVAWWQNPNTTEDYNQNVAAKDSWGVFNFHTTANGAIYCGIDTNNRFEPSDIGSGTVETDTWQHFAFTWNDGSATFYKNGIELASSSSMSSGSVTWDGLKVTDNDGEVDDVRFFDRELSQSDIQTVQNNPHAGQRLYWRLDDGSGSTATDVSGGGNNGTISGASWTTSGKYGDALSFSAPSDEVSTDSLDLTTSEFTVAWWQKPNTTKNYNQNVSAKDGWDVFNFSTDSNGAVYCGIDVDNRFEPSDIGSGTVETDTWQHFAFTWNDGSATFYKNGTELASASSMSSGSVTWDGFNVLDNDGEVDDVRFFDRELSSEDIEVVYFG